MVNAAVNIQAQVFVWLYVPRSEISRSRGCVYLVEELPLFSKATASFYSATRGDEGSSFSTSWPSCIIIYLFCDCHPNGCKVVSRCGSDLQLPGSSGNERVFACSSAMCVFSGEMFTQILNPFLTALLSFYHRVIYSRYNVYSVYILHTSPLSDIWFVKIFYLVAYLFLYSVWVTCFQSFHYLYFSCFPCLIVKFCKSGNGYSC